MRKHIKKIGLITCAICILIIIVDNNKPDYIHTTTGKTMNSTRTDSCFYAEDILVKHTIRDPMKRMKMMLDYHNKKGLSLEELKNHHPDIKFYYMGFSKNTCATRKFYIEKQTDIETNTNKTYLGSLNIVRNEEHINKWRIVVSYNLGTRPDADYAGPATERFTILDESDPNWYENNKDNELVNYYRQLQEEKQVVK